MESLKKCPVCGTLNSLSSKKCKCGYDFVKENEKSDKNQASQIDISQQISSYMEQEKARSKKLNIIKSICFIAIAVAIICSNIYIINQLYNQLHITKYNLNTSIEKINTLSKELSDLENEIKTVKSSIQNSYQNNTTSETNLTNTSTSLNEQNEAARKRLDEIYGLKSWEERKQAAENNSSSDWREREAEKKQQVHNDMRAIGLVPLEERKQIAQAAGIISNHEQSTTSINNNTLQTTYQDETTYNTYNDIEINMFGLLPLIIPIVVIISIILFYAIKGKYIEEHLKPKNIFKFIKAELGISPFVIISIGIILQFIYYTYIGEYIDSECYRVSSYIAILLIIFNILFTWALPICIALYIKYKIVKHPLKTMPAIVTSVIIFFIHIIFAVIIFPDGSHGSIQLVAFYVFRVLHKNNKSYIETISNYLQCPVCGFNNPADAFFCRCGYSFHTTPQAPKELNIRMFDKENGFFNKTETSDKVPTEYKNFIEPDGFLYAVGERQGDSIKYRFVEKKDWLNIINQNNSKPSETGHSPVYNDFEKTYNNIIKEISNLYKQDKKVFSKETLLSYKFEICTFMYFLTDFIMFKTNPSAREEICLKLSADIKNNICCQVEDFKHFFDMRIDLYGSIIRGEFEPANSLMLGNNSNDDTFMQLFRLLGDCIISSHYGYIPENDIVSSLRVVDFVDIVFLNQILMMVNKQTEKYCKKIYI